MMSKYSKFGVDTFYIFVRATLKFLHDDDNNNNDDDLAITLARPFLSNRRDKKVYNVICSFYGNNEVCYATVTRWVNKFKNKCP